MPNYNNIAERLQPLCKLNAYTDVAMVTFGEWLKERRVKVQMTQTQVADRAGLSFSYVSTLERQQPHSMTGRDNC